MVKFIDTVFNLTPLAQLPDELKGRQLAQTEFDQDNVGPEDAITPGISDLLDAFSPARLIGLREPLPPSYVTVPEFAHHHSARVMEIRRLQLSGNHHHGSTAWHHQPNPRRLQPSAKNQSQLVVTIDSGWHHPRQPGSLYSFYGVDTQAPPTAKTKKVTDSEPTKWGSLRNSPEGNPLAERQGFEPWVQLLTVQRFSKPPP